MPSKIPRPCSGSSTCPLPGTIRGRCPSHAAELEAERNRRRVESTEIYRSPRWRLLRAQILRARPWCEWTESPCFDAATDVDHVVPIADGGDPWHGPFAALCHRHHSVKTQRDVAARAGRRPRTKISSLRPDG